MENYKQWFKEAKFGMMVFGVFEKKIWIKFTFAYLSLN